jgi:hypothetical protein
VEEGNTIKTNMGGVGAAGVAVEEVEEENGATGATFIATAVATGEVGGNAGSSQCQ